MFYSDNPVRDAERWMAAQDQKLARRPVCDICGEHIQDDIAYNINGGLVCRDCLENNYMVYLEDD